MGSWTRQELEEAFANYQKVAAEAGRTVRRLEAAEARFGPGLRTGVDGRGRLHSLARTSPPLSGPDRRDSETIARDFVAASRDVLDVDDAVERSLELAQQYLLDLPGKIAESVKLARSGLVPARAWAHVGREESLSFNRRFLMKDGTVRFNPGKLNPGIIRPVGPIDPDVAVVYFDSPGGKPLATHVNFALHLDTVGGTEFAADYPYTLALFLGKITGPEMLALFTIGTAGGLVRARLDLEGKRVAIQGFGNVGSTGSR